VSGTRRGGELAFAEKPAVAGGGPADANPPLPVEPAEATAGGRRRAVALRSASSMKTTLLLAGLLVGLPTATAADATKTLPLGAAAPDFALPGVDGRTHRLADYDDAKLLAMVFTCNHCPTAQYYEERLKAIADDYRAKGVALVAISPNDPAAVRPDELGYTDLGDTLEEMKIRARDAGFNFPYLLGGGEHESVARAYGPVATPHVFVFDAERRLRYVGRIDDAERVQYVKTRDLRNALDALLAGKEPPVTRTKVVGCSTKWSDKRPGVAQFWERVKQEPVRATPVDAAGLRALRANRGSDEQPARLRLVNFWATWCGPCVTEFPELMMMNLQYRGRDFELVTVAAQYPDEEPEVLRFLRKQHASNRNLIFGDRDKYALMEAFDSEWSGALPFTLLIDPDGKVLYRREGAIEPLALKRLIVKELNARKPW
jgi:thiol-disulfide isomerase/thioredoxin